MTRALITIYLAAAVLMMQLLYVIDVRRCVSVAPGTYLVLGLTWPGSAIAISFGNLAGLPINPDKCGK